MYFFWQVDGPGFLCFCLETASLPASDEICIFHDWMLRFGPRMLPVLISGSFSDTRLSQLILAQLLSWCPTTTCNVLRLLF